jgi:hypothetical protein
VNRWATEAEIDGGKDGLDWQKIRDVRRNEEGSIRGVRMGYRRCIKERYGWATEAAFNTEKYGLRCYNRERKRELKNRLH